MDPAIELDGLERRYGERLALTGVTVSVPRGATLAVLGANGAGKTTLLRVLAGLLRPHAGAVRVLGAELPRERWKVPAQVGFLGHEPLLYRDLTGRENLTYHDRLHGVDGSRVEEVIAGVGMERRAGAAGPAVAPPRGAARAPGSRRRRAARAADRPAVGPDPRAREPRR